MIFVAFLKNSKCLNNLNSKYSPIIQHCMFSSKSIHKEGPAFTIREKIIRGQIKSDHQQTPIVNSLQEVYENIQKYSPGKFLSSKPPKGLYIYGSVGAGKTMLMDVFYQTVKIDSKRRTHFNNFMADVHSRIHQMKGKQKNSGQIWGEKSSSPNPIKPVAKQLVKEAWLLCLDEFQVTDIADAMILKRLFTEMFDNGMVMVATSNRSPDDLYKNGLQRSNFLPFIPVLKRHCNVVALSGKDYRTSGVEEIGEKYLITGEQKTKLEMENAFKQLCYMEKQKPGPKVLNILGHNIIFKNTCGRVLFTSFKDLCEKPLGSADYIKIVRNFDTILIKNIPKMNLETGNQARRFILLIDTLYDKKVRIMVSAETNPKNLFSNIGGKAMGEDQERIIMDDLNIQRGTENAKASLFSGSEEVFAFQRTVSRITEMCSNSYWSRYRK